MTPTLALLRAHNPKFFNKSTMKFFGKQKFKIKGEFLEVEYVEKCPRIVYWRINKDYSLTKENSNNETTSN